jgi:DNA-binding beta-propeller fold protein YncE
LGDTGSIRRTHGQRVCLGDGLRHAKIRLPRLMPFSWSLLLLIAASSLLISACGGPDVQITSTPVSTIAGKAGSFDNIEINQATHRLYVADRTDQAVDVFDISAPRAKYLGPIALPSSPNGLAVAPDLARLFVGTASGSVAVIDIKADSPTLETVIAEVPTGGKSADLLDYSAARNRLYVSNGADGTITSIDPSTYAVKAHFKVGFPLEQPRFNPADGMVYVTSPTADALFEIDPTDGLVKSKFSLGGCQPMGLAINPSSNQALIVCTTSVMSLDLRTVKSEAFGQVVGGDVVNYDASVDRFFVGSPRNSVVGIFGGNPIGFISSVVTGGAGNSAAYDETNDLVYTPDTRLKRAGIASFRVPATVPLWLSALTTIGPYAGVLAVLGLFVYILARSADPLRRRETTPRPAPTVAPVTTIEPPAPGHR